MRGPDAFYPGWHSGDAGVRLWEVHGATELRVFTVVAFNAAWNGGGVLRATAEINTSVPAGVYLFPTPGRGLPYGCGLGLSRCLGPECLHSFIYFSLCAHGDWVVQPLGFI